MRLLLCRLALSLLVASIPCASSPRYLFCFHTSFSLVSPPHHLVSSLPVVSPPRRLAVSLSCCPVVSLPCSLVDRPPRCGGKEARCWNREQQACYLGGAWLIVGTQNRLQESIRGGIFEGGRKDAHYRCLAAVGGRRYILPQLRLLVITHLFRLSLVRSAKFLVLVHHSSLGGIHLKHSVSTEHHVFCVSAQSYTTCFCDESIPFLQICRSCVRA